MRQSTHAYTGRQIPLAQPLNLDRYRAAGREAAALWLCQQATASCADWRDARFAEFYFSEPIAVDDRGARRAAFNDAYSRRIAVAIAHAEVSHG